MKLRRFKLPVKEPEKFVKPKKIICDASTYSLNNFGLGALGLGDLWGCINWLVNDGISKGHRIQLSAFHHGNDIRKRLVEIIAVMDIPDIIEIVNHDGKLEMDQYNFWTTKYHPTKIRWKNIYTDKFCYQLDGASNYWRKNPPSEDIEKLTSWCPDGTFTQLGRHLSIEQCVKIASESSMFFGVCSGMSHLAHSVGVPTFILEYGLYIPPFHVNKKYTRCCGTAKFLKEMEKFKQHLVSTRSRIHRYGLGSP